ncbi:MAG: hypothetical protein J6Q39_05540 [Bacteroidales bacterium]|nr:hypothetical protein [Bacteroidales bacterium]
MENTLLSDDVIFRSDLLKTILSRACSYVIGILSAYILPLLFQEGFNGVLDSITWDIVKQVSISIVIILLAEAGLRYLFYEISRLRANSDLREKVIILPKGVKLKEIVPFEVQDYIITYKFSRNQNSGGLDMTRHETATVRGGNYSMNEFIFNIQESFPKIKETDFKNKTTIDFKTRKESDLQDGEDGWTQDNSPYYVARYNNTIGPENENIFAYELTVTASDYITQDDIKSEVPELVSEKVILEIKDITIKVEFPDGMVTDLDFQAIGKSNVALVALSNAVKTNNNFDKKKQKSDFSIKIDNPVPDVRYGFKWKWKKPLNK